MGGEGTQRYRVVAHYRDPVRDWDEGGIEREVTVQADGPERAAVRAVIDKLMPIELISSWDGMKDVFWDPDRWPGQRWPEVVEREPHMVVAWGDEDNAGTLLLEVSEL